MYFQDFRSLLALFYDALSMNEEYRVIVFIEFGSILLGTDMKPEHPGYESPHKLRKLLIQRINHLSDQLSVETLRLFQALLKLSYQPILDTLIVRNFQERNYLDWNKVRKSRAPLSRTASIASRSSCKRKPSVISNKETPLDVTEGTHDIIETATSSTTTTTDTVRTSAEAVEGSLEISSNHIGGTTNETAQSNTTIELEASERLHEHQTSSVDCEGKPCGVDGGDTATNPSLVETHSHNESNIEQNTHITENSNVGNNTMQSDITNASTETNSAVSSDLLSNDITPTNNTELQSDVDHSKAKNDVELASDCLDDTDNFSVTIQFNTNENTKKEVIEESKQPSTIENVDTSFADSPQQFEQYDVARKGFIKKKIEKAVNGYIIGCLC